MNLVSHDCHSYLHVGLADGTPHRKGMVITGEGVLNDVDEEVYGGEGDETSVAREASDVDQRATADADQAGQLDISGETKTPSALRTPGPPTDTARMLHNMTHAPFRDWCPFCLARRTISSPHRRVVVSKTADTLPDFPADNMFIRTAAESKTQTCITLVDHAVERLPASRAPGKVDTKI